MTASARAGRSASMTLSLSVRARARACVPQEVRSRSSLCVCAHARARSRAIGRAVCLWRVWNEVVDQLAALVHELDPCERLTSHAPDPSKHLAVNSQPTRVASARGGAWGAPLTALTLL